MEYGEQPAPTVDEAVRVEMSRWADRTRYGAAAVRGDGIETRDVAESLVDDGLPVRAPPRGQDISRGQTNRRTPVERIDPETAAAGRCKLKDRTNGSTTYGGYRVVKPQAVEDGGWTVVDFNFASNPPCAYSTFTTCPLPPPENRLPVAVEAGLKQLPSVRR